MAAPILNSKETLLIGIGNSGRGDDGLGWAFVDSLAEEGWFNGKIIHRYQLQVEDAEMIRNARQVIFVDASHLHYSAGFEDNICLASADFAFTTHALPPEAVLHLCQDLYGTCPDARLLGISGERWDLHVGLSSFAENNLVKALNYFRKNQTEEFYSELDENELLIEMQKL